MLRLLALILPLCLDTFAVAAALAVADAGVARRARVRIGLLFALFEGGMPLLGLVVGAGLGRALGPWADWAAIAVLAALGLHMLLGGDEAEERRAQLIARTRGPALIGLGLSVSLDELAMGFTLGLLHVPVVPALAVIAVQAFLATQLGLAVGARVGERVREGAERLAAVALLALAALLAVSQVLAR